MLPTGPTSHEVMNATDSAHLPPRRGDSTWLREAAAEKWHSYTAVSGRPRDVDIVRSGQAASPLSAIPASCSPAPLLLLVPSPHCVPGEAALQLAACCRTMWCPPPLLIIGSLSLHSAPSPLVALSCRACTPGEAAFYHAQQVGVLQGRRNALLVAQLLVHSSL